MGAAIVHSPIRYLKLVSDFHFRFGEVNGVAQIPDSLLEVPIITDKSSRCRGL